MDFALSAQKSGRAGKDRKSQDGNSDKVIYMQERVESENAHTFNNCMSSHTEGSIDPVLCVMHKLSPSLNAHGAHKQPPRAQWVPAKQAASAILL